MSGPGPKKLSTEQRLAILRGDMPGAPGTYSGYDALDEIVKRRAAKTPDASDSVKKSAPADSSAVQLLIARVREALNPKRTPKGDNPLTRKVEK